MQIEQLNRRIWGRLRDRHFPATEMENSSFIIALRREKVLTEMGLRVVRFQNDEVVKSLSAVVGKIREVILL